MLVYQRVQDMDVKSKDGKGGSCENSWAEAVQSLGPAKFGTNYG